MPRALQNRCAKYVIKTFQKRKASLTGCSVTSGKPHFGPNLGLLGPNLGQRFFLRVQLYYTLDIVPSYNTM